MNQFLLQLKDTIGDRLTYFKLARKNLIAGNFVEKVLIKYIDETLENLEKERLHIERFSNYDDESLHQVMEISYRQLYKYFGSVIDLFEKFGRSKDISLNSPFINYIKKYFNELFSESLLMFLPHEKHSYAMYNLTDFLFKNSLISERYPEIIIINIPRLEKDNIFNHVLCAHEIGHFFLRKNEFYAKYFSVISQEGILENLDKKLEQIEYIYKNVAQKTLFFNVEKNEFKSRLLMIYINWLGEIFCDCIGMSLFGPAFFFALVNFLPFKSNFETYSDTHPPMWLRIFVLVKFMKTGENRLGYEKYFKNQFTVQTYKYWDDISVRLYNDFRKPSVGIDNTIYSIIDFFDDKYLEQIFLITHSSVNKKLFTLYDTEIIEKFTIYLKNNVPPIDCEDGIKNDISPLVFIINAGWNVYKTSFNEFMANCVPQNQDRETHAKLVLQELVTKSLSLSFINKVWKENG